MTPAERDEAIIKLLSENAAVVKRIEAGYIGVYGTPEEHHQHHEWIALALKKEAQSVALRQAIIEKTLTALVMSAFVALGIMFMSYLKLHGWKE